MTRQFPILLIVMLGFLLTPTLTYACGKKTKTEKSCCEKTSSKSQQKDCCKKEHSKTNKDNRDCEGNCGNASCHCPSVNFPISFPLVSELKHPVSFFEKQNIFYPKTNTSLPFTSMWAPPKIS